MKSKSRIASMSGLIPNKIPIWHFVLILITVAGQLVFLAPATANASHATITKDDWYYNSLHRWNGVKVYLSSPRHHDSGRRGECGWEENVNGRHFNYYAATGWYFRDRYNTTSQYRNLRARGYKVVVSANDRNDPNGWRVNRDSSNNWGADVHLVTHTNAHQGCGNSANYLLIMYRANDRKGIGLRDQLRYTLDSQLPGSFNHWAANWGELYTKADHQVYVELFFHTNRNAVNWFQAGGGAGKGRQYAWRYGWAIDKHLGYPR